MWFLGAQTTSFTPSNRIFKKGRSFLDRPTDSELAYPCCNFKWLFQIEHLASILVRIKQTFCRELKIFSQYSSMNIVFYENWGSHISSNKRIKSFWISIKPLLNPSLAPQKLFSISYAYIGALCAKGLFCSVFQTLTTIFPSFHFQFIFVFEFKHFSA